MAGLSCLACPVFVCGRCCCNYFGGKHRSPGWFDPGDRSEFEGKKIHNLLNF